MTGAVKRIRRGGCVVSGVLILMWFAAAPASAATITFGTSFGASAIPTHAITTASFLIQSSSAISGVGFTDSLPSGLQVANPANATDGCGGTLTATPGTSEIDLTNGTDNNTCFIGVDVTATTSGQKTNTTSTLTSSGGTASGASASMSVSDTAVNSAMAFSSTAINLGATTPLTVRLTNPYASTTVTGIGLTSKLPSGLAFASPDGLRGSCGGGTITAPAGGSTLTLSGASLSPHSACTFSAAVTATEAGQVTADITTLTADQGTTAVQAGAPLDVVAPQQPDSTYVTNGPVYTFARGNGQIYLGGAFSQVGPRTGPFAATSPITGRLDESMPPVSGGAGRIDAIVSDGAGGYFIGGAFTHVGGVVRDNAAHVLADGTVDPNWDPRPDDEVAALALSGSTVYMGGYFSSVDGTILRSYAAAVSATTGQATAWDPEPESWVLALAVSGSTVYMGGYFLNINVSVEGKTQRQFAAAVDSTNGAVKPWIGQTPITNPVDDIVRAIAVSGSTVFLGGDFSYDFAADDATTGAYLWGAIAPASGNRVDALATEGSDLFVAGKFLGVAGKNNQTSTSENLAALTVSGAPINWDPHVSGEVWSLATDGPTLYFGGQFAGSDSVGGATRNYLAAVNTSTGAVTGWDPNVDLGARPPSVQTPPLVDALAVSGSTVAAGGVFSSINAVSRSDAASINAADGRLTEWNPDPNLPVRAMQVVGSTVYLGGEFDYVNGNLQRDGAAAVDATTGLAKLWDPDTSPPGAPAGNGVSALAVVGGTVYLAGDFTYINGNTTVPRNSLAAVDATVGVATPWNPDVNGTVDAMRIVGSTVYFAGSFTTVNGGLVSRNNAAAVGLSSGSATSWNPNVNGEVNSLDVQGSTVFLGGQFSTVNGSAGRNNVAAVDAATGQATSWNPNVSSIVTQLSAADPGSVFMAGFFNSGPALVGSAVRRVVARVNTSSGAVESWDAGQPGDGIDTQCCNTSAVLADSAGGVLVGGNFTTFDLVPQQGFAAFSIPPANTARPRINGTAEPKQKLTCEGGSWSGSPGVLFYQWLRDGNPISGATRAAYAVTLADATHQLSCRVIDRNLAGPATAISTSIAVGSVVPVLSNLRIRPDRFRASAAVAYTLNERATTTFTVTRITKAGRRINAARFTRAGGLGQNRFRLSRRVHHRRLRSGRYVLTARPRSGGHAGRLRSVRFRVR